MARQGFTVKEFPRPTTMKEVSWPSELLQEALEPGNCGTATDTSHQEENYQVRLDKGV